MSGYVVMVDFRLKAGGLAEFRAMIEANACASVRDEPGCRRFDVVEPHGQPDRILLYEIYEDETSFNQHCNSAHFLSFDSDSARLVNEKFVIHGDLVCEG
jgi:(4S)-4-hydroxy-5-phosphonooxypentane-2,3-dione isomerase